MPKASSAASGKVFEVLRYEDVATADDGGREDMPIVRVGKRE